MSQCTCKRANEWPMAIIQALSCCILTDPSSDQSILEIPIKIQFVRQWGIFLSFFIHFFLSFFLPFFSLISLFISSFWWTDKDTHYSMTISCLIKRSICLLDRRIFLFWFEFCSCQMPYVRCLRQIIFSLQPFLSIVFFCFFIYSAILSEVKADFTNSNGSRFARYLEWLLSRFVL